MKAVPGKRKASPEYRRKAWYRAVNLIVRTS